MEWIYYLWGLFVLICNFSITAAVQHYIPGVPGASHSDQTHSHLTKRPLGTSSTHWTQSLQYPGPRSLWELFYLCLKKVPGHLYPSQKRIPRNNEYLPSLCFCKKKHFLHLIKLIYYIDELEYLSQS